MAMNLFTRLRAGVAAAIVVVATASVGCNPRNSGAAGDSARVAVDSMGAVPTDVRTVVIRTERDLVENSAAAMSATQPGVLFTINDSGNEAILYAVDTTGADRGAWRVTGSSDVDWEATAIGPCPTDGAPRCVYIGDTGDNAAVYPERTIYRVVEPAAKDSSFSGEVKAERLTYRYPDAKHDVEAMYVATNGDVWLITKRPLRALGRGLRPALVFRIPATAWTSKSNVVAELVDSLPVFPGSAPLRSITDASLSRDGKHLAVRTYSQVYVFVTDSVTGRVSHDVKPTICNVVSLGEPQGEGISWANDAGRFVFSSEGHGAPLHLATCAPASRSRSSSTAR